VDGGESAFVSKPTSIHWTRLSHSPPSQIQAPPISGQFRPILDCAPITYNSSIQAPPHKGRPALLQAPPLQCSHQSL
jgi:hypothetical protein